MGVTDSLTPMLVYIVPPADGRDCLVQCLRIASLAFRIDPEGLKEPISSKENVSRDDQLRSVPILGDLDHINYS